MNPLFAVLAVILLFTVCGKQSTPKPKVVEAALIPDKFKFKPNELKLIHLINASQDRIISFTKRKPVKTRKIASK